MANRDSENSVLTREQVLALDIATHTGYFSLHEAGTWNFTESKRRNGNKMHGAFRTTLLRGILLEVCDELDIPEPEFVNPAVLKKWATGDGHATKTQMVAACKDRYGIVPVDDNAADACHLFYYYIRRHRL